MSGQKIEQFWRDATADDIAKVMRGDEVEARFRDADTEHWIESRLQGWRCDSVFKWLAFDAYFCHCQVYEPPQWYIDKPDPGEGYRLLEKFPPEKLQNGDEWFCRGDKKWRMSMNTTTNFSVQTTDTWYRRCIEPKEVTPTNCVSYTTQVGEVIELPNGKRLKITQEGFEVL